MGCTEEDLAVGHSGGRSHSLKKQLRQHSSNFVTKTYHLAYIMFHFAPLRFKPVVVAHGDLGKVPDTQYHSPPESRLPKRSLGHAGVRGYLENVLVESFDGG